MKTKTILLSILFLIPSFCLLKAADWVDNDVLIRQIEPTDAEWKDPGFELNGWDSDSKGLFIDKTLFSTIEVGNALLLYLYDIQPDAKLFIGGYDLNPYPGSDLRVVPVPNEGTSAHLKLYVTKDMKAALQAGDFRLYGQNMKINRVEIWRGKAHVEGVIHMGKTIWTGYFWVEDNTLELYKEAFTYNSLNLNNFKAIRFYHEAERQDIAMNIFVDTWDDSNKIADQSTMTKTNNYSELVLTDEIRTKLSGMSSHLKVQCKKNEGAAFNFTDIVLIPNDPCDNCFYYTYYE